jgi:anti-sigma factor RsiW
MTEIHESTGSYALDALEPGELTEFEAHLATCPTCQNEVAELCETAAELSLLSLATPAPTLRDNILAAIATTTQSLADGKAAPTSPPVSTNGSRPTVEALGAVRSSGPRRAMSDSVTDEPESAPVDELALRRQRRPIHILSGLVAAMLALAVGLGGVIYTLVQDRQAQVAQIALEEQLYQAPDATTATIDLPDGGQATFIASKQLNRALFIGTDLPDPGQNRYQLWNGTGNPAVADEITGIARDNQITETNAGVKVFFGGNVAGSDFLAVNLEPAGSTPETPTTAVLAAAQI